MKLELKIHKTFRVHKKIKVSRPEGNHRLLLILLILACVFSNLSQLPVIVSAGMTQLFNMPLWLILFAYLAIIRSWKIPEQSFGVFFTFCLFILGLLILMLITGTTYTSSSVFTCLLLSVFIYFIGVFSQWTLSEEDYQYIFIAYALSALIVCAAVYLEYFAGGYDLSSRSYAYSSKNSVSQIIFTSIVILMFLYIRSYLLNILRIAAIAFEILVLIYLRSRATILGLIVCLLYIVIGNNMNKKLKACITILLVVVCLLLLFNSDFNNLFFNNVLLAGRDSSDLNDLTSGRLSIISSFPERISGHWLSGIGPIYFECFPLSAILQFGLPVGILILIIAYTPIASCLSIRKKNSNTNIFILICIAYAINSIFEGLAPIGPGVKCYFMWLLFGLLSGHWKPFQLKSRRKN